MTEKENPSIPDLGEGEYEVKLDRDATGEKIVELKFTAKKPDTKHPGQYL